MTAVLGIAGADQRKLIGSGDIGEGETVVLFNTGSGIKYLEAFGG